jgi:hypothetical protein
MKIKLIPDPAKHRAYLVTRHREVRKRLRWAFIHAAFLLFACDLVAAIWPAFNRIWTGVAHLGVALAALLATWAEYLVGEEFEPKHEEPPHGS